MSQPHWLTQLHWRILALISLALALLGIPLPGLPTVPFLLLAAWFAARGWPRLERWLLSHPRFGHIIVQWQEQRIVPRRAKWAATLMIALSLVVLWQSGISTAVAAAVTLIVIGVNLWLWQQKEQVHPPAETAADSFRDR